MDEVPWYLIVFVLLGGGFVYLLFMIFLPEWVGITGKTALENEKSHRGPDDQDPPSETQASSHGEPPENRTSSHGEPRPTTTSIGRDDQTH